MAPSANRVSSDEGGMLKYTSTNIHKKVDKNLEPEYRILFKYLGQSVSFAPENLNEVDIFGRHTSASSNISTKLTHKICVNARLTNLSTMNAMAEFNIKNALDYDSILVKRIFCINLSNNNFVDICKSFHPVTIPKFESTKIVVPVNKFAMGKTFKLIVYCEWQSVYFSNEYSLFIKSRPICSMNLTKLNNYFPKAEVRTLDRCNYRQPKPFEEYANDVEAVKTEMRDYEQMDTNSRLTSSNFYKMFKLMLQIEDENDSKRSLHYDQCERDVTHEFGLRYSMKIDDERLEAAVCEYKRIWITPMAIRQTEVKLNELRRMEQERKANATGKKHIITKFVSHRHEKNERIYGSIVEVIGDKVYFQLTEGLDYFTKITKVAPTNETYFIRFMNDRSTIALQHQALDHLNEDDITDFFFPNSSDLHNGRWEKPEPISFDRKSIRWQTGDINDEQKLAVVNILEQRSYPHPYILFGPPGTGKTKTLVEAILQMVRMKSMRKHVLVCATSNSACDEIVKRLIANGAGRQVFRIYAKSMEQELSEIPVEVLAVSNLSKSEHYYPSFAVLSRYKVIVCTLTSAGRLTQGHISPQFFSHIFIDEAGSATESQIMIAVAGLCSSKRKIHANLVLAGDPKQLGPLIKSQQAAKLGYGISMLERLINTNTVYMRNEKTKTFNENYITQLIRNYRSHSSILHISNKLFYDNALRVCAPEENINWFSHSDLLHKSNFPIVFHSVQGITVKQKNETSPHNEIEIKLIINYLKRIFAFERKIVQADIGIISPYRRQCEEIVNRCKSHGWHNIQTGSVEKFQGQEKPIIIVSTVRSKMKTIGFLDNEKRLNVLLTRAKCLLIIIGDAKTLAEDKYWKYVINYCKENNSLVS